MEQKSKYEIEIENFRKIFDDKKNMRIAIYGIGRRTATLLPGITDYNITGLLDRDENNVGKGKANPGCITAICDAVYTDDATAREFLQFIDEAITNVSDRTTLIGAYMNRVESAVDAISVQKENIVSANSSIKDADVATESSNYIKYQILQQSTATLLATANQTPSIALNLI